MVRKIYFFILIFERKCESLVWVYLWTVFRKSETVNIYMNPKDIFHIKSNICIVFPYKIINFRLSCDRSRCKFVFGVRGASDAKLGNMTKNVMYLLMYNEYVWIHYAGVSEKCQLTNSGSFLISFLNIHVRTYEFSIRTADLRIDFRINFEACNRVIVYWSYRDLWMCASVWTLNICILVLWNFRNSTRRLSRVRAIDGVRDFRKSVKSRWSKAVLRWFDVVV